MIGDHDTDNNTFTVWIVGCLFTDNVNCSFHDGAAQDIADGIERERGDRGGA